MFDRIKQFLYTRRYGRQFETSRDIPAEKLEEARKILQLRIEYYPNNRLTVDDVLDSMDLCGLTYLGVLYATIEAYAASMGVMLPEGKFDANAITTAHISSECITATSLHVFAKDELVWQKRTPSVDQCL